LPIAGERRNVSIAQNCSRIGIHSIQTRANERTKPLDPEGERAQLVASVKSDNAEVAAMEQQIKELLSETERLQNELQEIDNVCQIFLNFPFISD
jgi:TolA-binding protein